MSQLEVGSMLGSYLSKYPLTSTLGTVFLAITVRLSISERQNTIILPKVWKKSTYVVVAKKSFHSVTIDVTDSPSLENGKPADLVLAEKHLGAPLSCDSEAHGEMASISSVYSFIIVKSGAYTY